MGIDTLATWHDLVATRNARGIPPLLADDVVFHSPVVHTPQVGKALTFAYLQAAMQVLNNDSFRYLNHWYDTDSAVLEFECTVEGITVNGIGPGYFKTELTQPLVDDPAFSDWLIKRTPSRRWGDVEDLAPATWYFGVRAVSTAGIESRLSEVVSKTIP